MLAIIVPASGPVDVDVNVWYPSTLLANRHALRENFLLAKRVADVVLFGANPKRYPPNALVRAWGRDGPCVVPSGS